MHYQKKKIRKKAAVICAVTAVILAAGTIFGISARNDDTGYSCYRIKCVNILSSESVNEVIINGDNASLNVEYGEVDCDIEIGTISGNQLSVNEIPQQDSDKTTLVADFTYVDIEDAYCADEPDKVTLILPENYNGSVRLIGSDTEIYCTGCHDADADITLSCPNGNVTIEGVSAGNVSLSSETGTVFATGVTADHLSVYSKSGGMSICDTTVNKKTYLKAEDDYIDLMRTHFIGETDIASLGYIYGEDMVFEGDTNIYSRSPYISLVDADFENMIVIGSGSDTDISISTPDSRSDYTLTAEADSGICNVQSGGDGPYTLNVRTVGGDIKLIFDLAGEDIIY